jgi:hypothetical protein
MPAAVLWLPAPTVSRMELRIPRRRNNVIIKGCNEVTSTVQHLLAFYSLGDVLFNVMMTVPVKYHARRRI